MESGSLQAVAESCLAVVGPDRQPPWRHLTAVRRPAVGPTPGGPAAVVVAGAGRPGRRALVAALLGVPAPALDVPVGDFLVIKHGMRRATVAYLPGCRAPRPYLGPVTTSGPDRPPRRVELSLPESLLCRVEFVDAPDTAALGVAGHRVLLDVIDRAGALLYVLAADQPIAPADLDLLTGVSHRAAVFFAVTPGAGGWTGPIGAGGGAPAESSTGYGFGDRAAEAVRTQRAALLADVPSLASAAWFAVDPGGTAAAAGPGVKVGAARSAIGPADLRRALVEWASLRALDRVDDSPTVPGHTVRVAPDAYESNWATRLDQRVRDFTRRIRGQLATDLRDLHQRCARAIDGPTGCPGLPELLDREVHALSVYLVAACDAAVVAVLDASVAEVFGTTADDGVRSRVATAVRRGFGDDPTADDLERLLLVTTTGGIATVTGAGAVVALAAWSGPTHRPAILPPVGVGLSGGCYRQWRKPANADPERARAWLARVLAALEPALAEELARRLDVVRRALAAVLTDAVDHGILL